MPCLIFLELFIVVAQEFFPVIGVGSLCILLLTNIVNIHDYKPECFLPKSYFKVAKNKQTNKQTNKNSGYGCHGYFLWFNNETATLSVHHKKNVTETTLKETKHIFHSN